MRIFENPFCVLRVTTYSSVDEINENAENKAFMDDGNSAVYEEARTALISPNKRIGAEVRWFYCDGFDLEKLLKSIKIAKFNAFEGAYSNLEKLVIYTEQLYYADVNILVQLVSDIDSLYSSVVDDKDLLDELCDNINIARRKAKVSLLKNKDDLYVQIVGIKEDVRNALNYLMEKNGDTWVIDFANELADMVVSQKKSYGDIFEIFLSMYSLKFSDVLHRDMEHIFNLVEEAKKYTKPEELNGLCEAVKNFDYIAQPLQLLLRERGQSNMQKESVAVAKKIRNLALYFHNVKGLTNLSVILNNLAIEFFSELSEFYDVVKKDKKTLSGLIVQKDLFKNFDSILNILDGQIEKSFEYREQNKMYLENQEKAILENIDYVLANSDDSSKDMIYRELAIRISVIAAMYMWSCVWQKSLDLYQKAYDLAKEVNDNELCGKIQLKMADVNFLRTTNDTFAEEKRGDSFTDAYTMNSQIEYGNSNNDGSENNKSGNWIMRILVYGIIFFVLWLTTFSDSESTKYRKEIVDSFATSVQTEKKYDTYDDFCYGKKVFVWDMEKQCAIEFDKYHKDISLESGSNDGFCVLIYSYEDECVSQYKSGDRIIPGYRRTAYMYVYDTERKCCVGQKVIRGDSPLYSYRVKSVPKAFYGEIRTHILEWVYEHWKP